MRGMGRVYRKTYVCPPAKRTECPTCSTGENHECSTWTLEYYTRGGKQIRETSKTHDKKQAVKLLKKRIGENGIGKAVGPQVERTTFDDLAKLITTDYAINKRKTEDDLKARLGHLRDYFGPKRKAADIDERAIAEYVQDRLVTKTKSGTTKNATINRELAALKRMFRLAERAQLVGRRPYIPMLAEKNARKGFFDREQLEAVLSHLPDDLKALIEVAYITGWRVDSELSTRQWHHVDFKAGWLRLEPGETKNGEGRDFPLTDRLRRVLEDQRERTRAIEHATGQIVPWVFWRTKGPGVVRSGTQVGLFRKAWMAACVAAGLGIEVRDTQGRLVRREANRIPHDFRRSAVRNLERASVPRSAAMKLVGHKTESIYRRYAIADESMLKDAAEKLSKLYAAGLV